MKKRVNTAAWLENQNRWQIKVQKNGERKTFTSSTPGRTGQRECHAKADAWLDEGINKSNWKVGRLFDEYIEELKITTSQAHWRQYEAYGRLYIKPKLQTVSIANITEQHMQNVINQAYRAGLAKKTLSNIRACMYAFIKYCRKNKATTLLPENVSIPKGAKQGVRTILQPKDLAILFSNDTTLYWCTEQTDLYINAYRFAVLTGLRPGEIFGLQPSDIKGDVISIKRSINQFGEETRGKNDNARRSFVLTHFAKLVLDSQKALLREFGISSKYVFCNKEGEPIKTRHYGERWARYCEFNDIDKCTPYELRHTFVSVVKTLPPGMLKPLIGHSEDMDTLGTYGHEIEGDMKIAADKVSDIFEKLLSDSKKD